MKSLRATTKNNNKNAEDDNNSKHNDNNNAAGKDDVVEKTAKKKNGKKKRGRKLFWDDEYVSRLESLFDMDAPSESLAAGEDDAYDAFPGQRKNVVVLGDWMEWEEGGAESRSCVGDSCGDDSEVSMYYFFFLVLSKSVALTGSQCAFILCSNVTFRSITSNSRVLPRLM